MKKCLISMCLLILGLCLGGCRKIVEYAPLSLITNNENFTSAYVSSVNGTSQVIDIDFNDLKVKAFYNNIMNYSAKPVDVLPEVIPTYSLIISSNNNSLQIDDLGDLYAKYQEKWYLILCYKEDKISLYNYLLGIEETSPNDPLQIIRNNEGKILFTVIATMGDSCDIKYKNLRENITIDSKNKNEIFDYLVDILLYGKESIYDYPKCDMDFSIEITYDIYNNPEIKFNTYEFKFNSECNVMTILKNNNLIGTVLLSNDEMNTLLNYMM